MNGAEDTDAQKSPAVTSVNQHLSYRDNMGKM